jgi:hypothetical protein
VDESIDLATPLGLRIIPGAEAHLDGRNGGDEAGGNGGEGEGTLAHSRGDDEQRDTARVEEATLASSKRAWLMGQVSKSVLLYFRAFVRCGMQEPGGGILMSSPARGP